MFSGRRIEDRRACTEFSGGASKPVLRAEHSADSGIHDAASSVILALVSHFQHLHFLILPRYFGCVFFLYLLSLPGCFTRRYISFSLDLLRFQSLTMARHPLQRLSSPSPSLSLILHVLGVLSFTYNFHFLTVWETPFAVAYGWHFQFLTILGLSASLLSFAIGILSDLTLSTALFNIKNAICIVATPLEVLISLLYWGIRAIDPSLLMPDEFQIALIPDIGFHLAPAVFLTLDLVLFSPPWTIPTYGVFSISTALAFSYWYWVELCFSHNGWYGSFPASVLPLGLTVASADDGTDKLHQLRLTNRLLTGTHTLYLACLRRPSASCYSPSARFLRPRRRLFSSGFTRVSMGSRRLGRKRTSLSRRCSDALPVEVLRILQNPQGQGIHVRHACKIAS